jgi:PIN domain nuclease of toxin-antitoxin system
VAMYVTDTHALIWYAQGRLKKLGRRARAAYERAEAGHASIYVSTITLVELSEAVRRGTIRPSVPIREWVKALFSSGNFVPVELSLDVVFAAEDLTSIRERGDRVIAATAAVLDLPLLTRDQAIEDAGIEVVW